MKRVIFFVEIIISGFFSACWAQEIDLEKIVVTPYKSEVSYKLNPASVDIISVEEENSQGKFTLIDSLKNLSSLSYATSGGLSGVTGVFIRGANSEHTQVLLDGIKLYDPIVTSGYFYGYNYLSLDNLDKIEVLKGPYSSLYGSGSLGGTISMLTRKGRGKPKLSYTQEMGSYKTFREKISSDGEIDKFAYSFSISKADIESFYSTKYKDGNHERDPFHNFNSSVRLDYNFNNNLQAALITDYTYTKYEYDGSSYVPPYSPIDDDDNYAYFYQGIGNFTINNKVADNFSHKLTLGYTRTYRQGWEDSTTDYWYDGKTYQGKWQGDYQLCSWNKAIFGFDYLRELGEGFWAPSRTPKETANTKGYYLENAINPLDNLFFVASYRIEDHSAFKRYNTYSFSGSYTYKKTNTKIKGSYGKGFKAPSLYQLYGTYGGNPQLNPEISKSYEAGIQQSFGSLELGTTYFHTSFSNLIDYVSSNYMNTGKSRIYGVENFLAYKVNKNASLKVSYTYMDTQKKVDKTRLLRRPNNKLTCEARMRFFDKLDIAPELSYVGNRIDSTAKLKSYFLANMALNYTINNELDAFLRFENIFDYDYELVDGYQTPKFSWYLGAKYTF